MLPLFFIDLDALAVGRIVHDAEGNEDRQENIQQAVNGAGDVNACEFLYAENDQRTKCQPQCPGLKSRKKVTHSFFLLK